MNDTTAHIITKTADDAANSSGRGKPSSSAQLLPTLSLFGESSSTTPSQSKTASTAQSSETKAPTYRPSLSDRLTQSLITAGLVRGITPTSARKQCGAVILDFAFSRRDGGDAEKPKAACSSLSGDR